MLQESWIGHIGRQMVRPAAPLSDIWIATSHIKLNPEICWDMLSMSMVPLGTGGRSRFWVRGMKMPANSIWSVTKKSELWLLQWWLWWMVIATRKKSFKFIWYYIVVVLYFFVIATSQAYLAAGLSHLPLGVLLGMPPFAGARKEQFIWTMYSSGPLAVSAWGQNSGGFQLWQDVTGQWHCGPGKNANECQRNASSAVRQGQLIRWIYSKWQIVVPCQCGANISKSKTT